MPGHGLQARGIAREQKMIYAPIASAAALIERPVQGHSTEGGHWCTTAPP